jgi:hypothetical protein
LADQATLAQWLTDAEIAYNNLVTGCAPKVVVDQNGERVEYVHANLGKLAMYIEELKRKLGLLKTCGGPMEIFP